MGLPEEGSASYVDRLIGLQSVVFERGKCALAIFSQSLDDVIEMRDFANSLLQQRLRLQVKNSYAMQ